MATAPVFEATNLTRRFGGVTALDGADVLVRPGEVHGLVGENGAGKTTLIRIAAGLVRRDGGDLRLDGQRYDPSSVLEAAHHGVRVVSQEFDLAPNMSVAENLCLGSGEFLAEVGAGWYSKSRANEAARGWLDSAGVPIDPRTPVSELSVSARQLVALVRGVLDRQRIVFLDEPSSALDQEGMTILTRMVNQLRDNHVAVVYVSHKLEEIFELCDRVTVMRDGRTVAVRERADTTVNEVVNLMVGREIDRMFPSRPGEPPGPAVLQLSDLTAPGVHGVDLTLRRGEILGIGGLVGSGRTELAKAVCGLSPVESGEIRLEDRTVAIRDRTEALRLKIEYVTEDRHGEGLVFSRPIAENISLRVLRHLSYGPLVNSAAERRFARRQMADFKIAAASETMPVQQLSGGNQQKTLLAACIASDPNVIFFDEPTRGIDVGAKAQIYELIRELSRGRAVAVISSELIELLGLADRIVMMRAGRLVAEFDARTATEEVLISAALGVSGAAPA